MACSSCSLDSHYADHVLVAAKRSPQFKEEVAGLHRLRKAGVAEPDSDTVGEYIPQAFWTVESGISTHWVSAIQDSHIAAKNKIVAWLY